MPDGPATTAVERSTMPMAETGLPHAVRWGVAGFTLLALALRLACINESFFGDELFTYKVSGQSSFRGMLADVCSPMEITPPLFFVVAWAFARIGDPFIWLRMASVLSSTATVPLLYLLGRRTMGRAAGVVAGSSPAAASSSTERLLLGQAPAVFPQGVPLEAAFMVATTRRRSRLLRASL